MTLSPLARKLARRRLLIFDLDGTLVDSSPLHARAYRETFAPHGIAVDYSAIAGLPTGSAVDQLARQAGLDLSEEARAAMVAGKRDRALALIESELVAIEGAVEFVKAARARFALALCTSASRRSAERSVELVGLDGCFDPVVTAEDVQRGKPDPEPFLMALEAHGALPGEALVFEDAESGLAAAAAAGIEAIRIGATTGGLEWGPLIEALGELR